MADRPGATAAEKAAKRRGDILAAAGKLFTTKGYDGTTTLDIAREAGLSKRDLYAAFATKEDMLGALVASRVERMRMQEGLGTPHSRTQVLRTLEGYAGGMIRFLTDADATGLYRLAISGAERQPIIGRTLLNEGIAATTAHVEAFVQAAVERGYIKAIDVGEAVRCYLAIASGPLPLRRLLDPDAAIGDDEVEATVRRAMTVLLSFEGRT